MEPEPKVRPPCECDTALPEERHVTTDLAPERVRGHLRPGVHASGIGLLAVRQRLTDSQPAASRDRSARPTSSRSEPTLRSFRPAGGRLRAEESEV